MMVTPEQVRSIANRLYMGAWSDIAFDADARTLRKLADQMEDEGAP